METATTVSDRDTSEDDHHCSDESEYGSDDECIDILNGNNSDALSPASEEQKEESCDGVSNANKFSIDTILGLKSKDNECNRNELKCKETKCIKPTPVPAIPRGKHLTINNRASLAKHYFLHAASLYGSIIELPQYGRPDSLPPDPGVLDFLSASKLSHGQSNSSEASGYSPYHLHAGTNSASLLYSSWLGAAADHKNASHIFGLQGNQILLLSACCHSILLTYSLLQNTQVVVA